MPFGFGHYCGTEAQLAYEENTQMRYVGSVGYVVRVDPPSIPMISAIRPFHGQMRDANGAVYIAQDGKAKWVYGGSTK